MVCVLSVDVEDWFHILDVPSTPPLSRWDSMPSRVEANFEQMLDLFTEKNAKVTCFFLGWVAARFPELVKKAQRRGHEVASHGYAHQLTYTQTSDEFFEDVVKAKGILEDITGAPVLGYRSPGFSATADVPWFFDRLIEAGYTYDSSVFPAPRGHGGMQTDQLAPYVISRPGGEIVEFPITVTRVLGRPMCFFGGGYLRLFPYPLVKRMSQRVLGESRPVVFYVHPREIDPDHPRLPMSPARRFKSYVGLDSTQRKLRKILDDFPVTTFESALDGVAGRSAASRAA